MTFKLSRRAWIRTVLYSSAAMGVGIGYLSSKRIELARADVPVRGLPSRLEGLTIGVMSDFHAGAFTTNQDIHRATDIIEAENPDLIALLGDYVDGAYSHSSENVTKGGYVFQALKRLKAPLGVYAVLGNHDHWTDAGRVREEMSKLSLTLLDNRGVDLEHDLAVAGVDDLWEGPAFAHKAIQELSPQSLVILLSHNPDVNLQLGDNARVTLVLSGHTHGGQVRVPVIHRAPWIPCLEKYQGTSGLIRETQHRWTFITKGVGTFFLPFRFACPPDVGIIRLIRA